MTSDIHNLLYTILHLESSQPIHIKNPYLPTYHPVFATPGAARAHHRQTPTFISSQAMDGEKYKGLSTKMVFELMDDGQPQPSGRPPT